MTLQELYKVLQALQHLQTKGSSRYKQIVKLLNQEATTHNCEEAKNLLEALNNF